MKRIHQLAGTDEGGGTKMQYARAIMAGREDRDEKNLK